MSPDLPNKTFAGMCIPGYRYCLTLLPSVPPKNVDHLEEQSITTLLLWMAAPSPVCPSVDAPLTELASGVFTLLLSWEYMA